MTPTNPGALVNRYHSYLLRLERKTQGDPWLIQLNCLQTGEKLRFTQLEELFNFLRGSLISESSNTLTSLEETSSG